jgi:WD40 repeat protein
MPESNVRWPVFICYRQSDGRATAEWLNSLLNGLNVPVPTQKNTAEDPPRLDVYYDQTAPGVGDWTQIHEPYLKRARAFIVVCTPGAKINEGDGDWVHREIDWWLEHRDTAPIVIDALGEGERYVPTRVSQKWPNAQRIELIAPQWDSLTEEELKPFQERTRARILGGITYSGQSVYRQELEQEKKRTEALEGALVAKDKLSRKLTKAVVCITVLFLLALGAAGLAEWQRNRAEDRRVAALTRQLAATSQLLANRSHFQLQTSALLTLEGLRLRANPQLAVIAHGLLSDMLRPILEFSDIAAFGASSDGGLLATAEILNDKLVIVVRGVPDNKELARFELPKGFTDPRLSFDPATQKLIINGSEDAWAWDWSQSKPPYRMKGLGQRKVVVSKTGRWAAGLDGDGLHVHDMTNEILHRVFAVGEAPWMHSAAFSQLNEDILLLARDDDPGSIALMNVENGEVEKKVFVTRVTAQIDPDTPIVDVLGSGRTKTIDRGVEIDHLLVSPDGATVAAVEGRFISSRGDDWQVHLWDVSHMPQRTGTIVHSKRFECVMPEDGKFLVCGDEDGNLSIHRLPKGELLQARHLGRRIRDLAVSRDGLMVAASLNGDTAVLWDWRADSITGRAPAPTELSKVQLRGKVLFGITHQHTLTLWQVPGRVAREAIWFRGRVRGLVAAPAGDVAVGWTDYGDGVLWRPSKGEMIREFRGDIRDVQLSDNGDCAAILVGNRLSVSGSRFPNFVLDLPEEYEEVMREDRTRLLWVKADTSDLTMSDAHFEEKVSLTDCTSVQEGQRESTVTREVFWSVGKPQEWPTDADHVPYRGQGSFSHTMAIRGDGEEVAVSILGWIFRYDLNAGIRTASGALGYQIPEREPYPGADRSEQSVQIERLIYGPDGTLWVNTREDDLWCWSKDGLKRLGRHAIAARTAHRIAERINENSFSLYGDVTSPRTTAPVDGDLVALSPDGEHLATVEAIEALKVRVLGGHNPGGLRLSVYKSRAGTREWTRLHTGARESTVQFSPDSSLLALGDQDGSVRVWRVNDGEELTRLSVPGAVSHLAFSHDGTAILVSSEGASGILRVVPVSYEDLRSALRTRVLRELSSAEWDEYMEGEVRRSPGSGTEQLPQK